MRDNPELLGRSIALLASCALTWLVDEGSIPRPLFEEGERVLAYYKTKKTKVYPGVIREINKNGTYVIHYDDGDKDANCPESNIFTEARKRKEAPVITANESVTM